MAALVDSSGYCEIAIFTTKYRISPMLAPSLIYASPSFWDQENILWFELKITKSTNFYLNTIILPSIYQQHTNDKEKQQ